MTDPAELFPIHSDTRPPREGFATRPIGRRRTAPRPRLRNRASALGMLAQIRSILDSQLGGMRQSLRGIEQETRRLANKQSELAESVARLQGRIVAIERNTAVRPLPEIPAHTRRRPVR